MAITEESQLDYLPLREDPEEHKVLFLFLLLLLVVVTLRFESEIPVPVFTVITVYIIILFTFSILLPHPGIKPYQYCTWLVGPYLGPNVLLQPYMRIFEMHYLSHQTAPRPRQSRLILFCTKMHLDWSLNMISEATAKQLHLWLITLTTMLTEVMFTEVIHLTIMNQWIIFHDAHDIHWL